MLADRWVRTCTWWSDLRMRAREARGASAVEYAVLLALIIGILILVIEAVGEKSSGNYEKLDTSWP